MATDSSINYPTYNDFINVEDKSFEIFIATVCETG